MAADASPAITAMPSASSSATVSNTGGAGVTVDSTDGGSGGTGPVLWSAGALTRVGGGGGGGGVGNSSRSFTPVGSSSSRRLTTPQEGGRQVWSAPCFSFVYGPSRPCSLKRAALGCRSGMQTLLSALASSHPHHRMIEGRYLVIQRPISNVGLVACLARTRHSMTAAVPPSITVSRVFFSRFVIDSRTRLFSCPFLCDQHRPHGSFFRLRCCCARSLHLLPPSPRVGANRENRGTARGRGAGVRAASSGRFQVRLG